MGTAIDVHPRSAGVKAMQAAAPRLSPGNTVFERQCEDEQALDAQALPDLDGLAWKLVNYGSRETIFAQGDPATSVLYVQKGAVKRSLVNEAGKEAVVEILVPGDFLGEGCLVGEGQSERISTAETILPSAILFIEKPEMIRLLHSEHALSDRFIKHLLPRESRIEDSLVDQLFNSAEKRLARTLLLLARYDNQPEPKKIVRGISQEVLAEMIGTTRPQVNRFMNKFRKLGFIDYGRKLRGLHINKSLLNVILRD